MNSIILCQSQPSPSQPQQNQHARQGHAKHLLKNQQWAKSPSQPSKVARQLQRSQPWNVQAHATSFQVIVISRIFKHVGQSINLKSKNWSRTFARVSILSLPITLRSSRQSNLGNRIFTPRKRGIFMPKNSGRFAPWKKRGVKPRSRLCDRPSGFSDLK